MKIDDYQGSNISRLGLDMIADRVARVIGIDRLWNEHLQRPIIRYGCFDNSGRYFGNLGIEPEYYALGRGKWLSGGYAHFNLRGVRPEDFGIYKDWQPGEFAPFMKHHPAIWKRVAKLKDRCELVNIHIYDDINIAWGPW